MRASAHVSDAEELLRQWHDAEWNDDENVERLLGAVAHSLVGLVKVIARANEIAGARFDAEENERARQTALTPLTAVL